VKTASAGTIALLASNAPYFVAECYDFTINGVAYHYTSYDQPLTVGGTTYLTGLTIERGPIKESVGLTVETLDLRITPQADNPGGAPTIAGYPFLQSIRAGWWDGVRITMSKIFMPTPTNTANGKTLIFTGRVSDCTAGRAVAKFTISSDMILLNTSMPRNLFQTGCVHTLFDAGCTLSPATFAVTAVPITALGPAVNVLTASSLAQAAGYFARGRLVMTSGAAAGFSTSIQGFASGVITANKPLPSGSVAVHVGDQFTIYPGCDRQQSTCNTKFSNTAHFRGYRFLPQPETQYSGGTTASESLKPAGQQGITPGGTGSGAYNRSYTYKP
jgi:uncharacterized phage protein (TIGR02218 family)